MPGALFSRLNRSFGTIPSHPQRRTATLQKIEQASTTLPLLLESRELIAPQQSEKSVVVVGAGFAGLTAAWWLSTHGFRVTVVEARNRVGGRVFSHVDSSGPRVLEHGGELIGRNHPNWLRLAQYFGLTLSLVTTDENYSAANLKSPTHIDGQFLSIIEQQTLYDEMKQALATLNPFAARVDPNCPWKSKLKDKDNIRVADWIRSLKGISPRARDAIRFQLECDQTIPVEQQSLLGLLSAVSGGGLTKLSARRKEPSEFWTETEVFRCSGGNQQLAACFQAEIESSGGRVITSSPISKIEMDSKGVNVVNEKKKEFSGRWVIVAIPPSCWDRIQFPFTDTKPYKMSMGPAFKCLADTKKRFWLRDCFSPNATDDQFGMVWEGTDNEDGSGGAPELTVFAGGPIALAPTNSSNPDQYFQNGLDRLHNGFKSEMLGTTCINWSKEEWTWAGYSCPTRGQVTTVAEALSKPVEKLVWAGEHTCMAYFGYMEGALQSGMYAAQLIADAENISEVQRIRGGAL